MTTLYEKARENVRLAYFHGQRHRLPNGTLGTVLKCPWPGCNEDGVEGWSACSTHFSDMHPQHYASTNIRSSYREPQRSALHFWEHT